MENLGVERFSGVLTGRGISELRRKNGRWHDNRHALVAEVAESGVADEIIMSIAGHVSREMLSRYRHVRNEAKHKALEEICARQTAAEAATQKMRDAQAQAQLDGGTLANVAPALAIQ